MPTFIIEERVPCVQVWTYAIVAATEEEAMELVIAGKATASDTVVDDHDYDATKYEITDEEEYEWNSDLDRDDSGEE
jgi:hypothetical protein